MKTQIEIEKLGNVLEVKESYGTVRQRLAKDSDFFEVTSEKGKITLNKNVVILINPIGEKE